MRAGAAGVAPRFAQELEASLAGLHAPRVSRKLEELSMPAHGLSLVEDSQTDEGSVLGSIVSRSELRNSLALQLMGYRYGVLAAAPAFEAEHLPFGPHALCHALRNASEPLQLAEGARIVLSYVVRYIG